MTGHPHGHPGGPPGTHHPYGSHRPHGDTLRNAVNELRLVFWESTAGCNLECIHCRRLDVASQLMREDLATDEVYRMIDQITEVGHPIFVLSGGEPLMRPDIFDIARYAVSAGLITSLATNGTLINAETAKRIADAGIARCSISLDGANAKTHDAFRMLPGSFDTALRGIAHLRDAGVEFQINTTIAKHNDGELEAIYDLAKSIGAVALHAFMLVPVGCGVEIAEDQMLSGERYEEVLNEFYALSQRGEMQLKATCAPHYYRIIRQQAKEQHQRVTYETHGMAAVTKGCLAGTAVCFVSHKGEVFPCGYLPVEAGNVRTQSFAEVWQNSTVFRTLREDGLEGKCGLCEYRNVCAGCRARAFYAAGSMMAEEPFCTYVPRQASART